MTKDKLTKTEEEDIHLYIEQIENIKSSSFYKFISENDIRVKWRLSRTEGFSLIYTLPQDESIKAFVVDFSQIFLTDKQPANFHHICNILYKKINDSEIKKAVISLREQYSFALNEGVISVILNNKKFSPKETLNDWLMGYYRHNDKETRAKISEWQAIGGDFYKFHFINSLLELTKPILDLALVIERYLH